jgi:hypothetical protein
MIRPLQTSQSAPDDLSVSMAIHPAAAFTGDGRPVFPAHMRDLSSSIIRAASFSIALGGRITDGRAPHETTVAGCESAACVIPSREGVANG